MNGWAGGLDLEVRGFFFLLLVSAGGSVVKRNLATFSSGPNVRESADKRIGPEQVATSFHIMHRISRGRERSEGGWEFAPSTPDAN